MLGIYRIKGIGQVGDGKAVRSGIVKQYHRIKPAQIMLKAGMTGKKVLGCDSKPAAFFGVDTILRRTGISGSAGFHFHKHQMVFLRGNNVDFSKSAMVIPANNVILFMGKKVCCCGFTSRCKGRLFYNAHVSNKNLDEKNVKQYSDFRLKNNTARWREV